VVAGTVSRFNFTYDAGLPASTKATFMKFDEEATHHSETIIAISNWETHINNERWSDAADWTSFGAIDMGEAADAVCYVKRIA
jgi:hypothetical protein